MAREVGWLGTRCAIVLSLVSGVPLLVYSIAKVIVLDALNSGAGGKIEGLKKYSEESKLRLNISLIGVSALPLLILSGPALIRAAYQTYLMYESTQEIIHHFRQSESFQALENSYHLLANLVNGMHERRETAIIEEVV
ncbi:hypothetical protein PNK_0538 [Candidatus Protochlamydia naegleriophila]|uniref:Uncharacterized protein n=1 Tax=Candidatus Protochlamydia naegleriophila TaxID=389348 RepID=A0A0U5JEH0_9BACT|nr:hypothetical protein PNK_0538 [Candidatus Protochlamydia naegleriophila]